jgi:hypothetical protein
MRRIVVLAVGLLVLGALPVSAEPDVVRKRTCGDGARSRVEVTDIGDRIRVRVEVHRSPPGHSWRIRLRYKEHNIFTIYGHVFFRGTRVASESGDLVVQLTRPDWGGIERSTYVQTGSTARRLTGRQVRSARHPPGIGKLLSVEEVVRDRVAASPSSPSRRRVQRRFPCLRYPTLAIRPQRSLCVDLKREPSWAHREPAPHGESAV